MGSAVVANRGLWRLSEMSHCSPIRVGPPMTLPQYRRVGHTVRDIEAGHQGEGPSSRYQKVVAARPTTAGVTVSWSLAGPWSCRGRCRTSTAGQGRRRLVCSGIPVLFPFVPYARIARRSGRTWGR